MEKNGLVEYESRLSSSISISKRDADSMLIGRTNHLNKGNGLRDCIYLSNYLSVTERDFSYWDSLVSELSVILLEVIAIDNQHFITMMYLYEDSIRQHMPILAHNIGNKLVYLRLEEMIINVDQSQVENHMRNNEHQPIISMIKNYNQVSDTTTLPELYETLKDEFKVPEDTMLYSDWVYTQ